MAVYLVLVPSREGEVGLHVYGYFTDKNVAVLAAIDHHGCLVNLDAETYR